MNAPLPSGLPAAPIRLVPDTAPFDPDQRAWLNGFLAAALGAIAPPGGPGIGAPAKDDAAEAGPVLAGNDDAPWHDPSLPTPDRMKMAEGYPQAPRLMAAMAQQDCGQCGYSCADYANALFLGTEGRQNLCAPGGKETMRLVKALMAEFGGAREAAPAAPAAPALATAGAAADTGPSRENPGEAVFLGRRRLTGEGSEKTAYHIEFDLEGSGLDYAAGDSFGVFPENHPGYVDQLIGLLGASPQAAVRNRTLREVLLEEVSLGPAPDALAELFSYLLGSAAREKAKALARGEDPDGDAAALDVLGLLHKFPAARPHPEAFVEALEPLQPRLYSISSSPAATPGKISLTIDAVRYRIGRRLRFGCASTFLGERAVPGRAVRAYVQKAHNFALPKDPAKPIVMVGPGTGIAPFRSFLHERRATGAPGRNWLFFGHQRQASDFFYAEELAGMKKAGHLTRLSLAWSRDGREKIYVQDRMREVGADLFRWLEDGAHFYICGDAKRMAKDVEAALVEIVARHGKRGIDAAIAYVSDLKKTARYQADVY